VNENGNGDTLRVRTPFGEIAARGGLVLIVILNIAGIACTITLARLMRVDQELVLHEFDRMMDRQQIVMNAVTKFCKGAEGLQIELDEVDRKRNQRQ
jgi:hypothetical protein